MLTVIRSSHKCSMFQTYRTILNKQSRRPPKPLQSPTLVVILAVQLAPAKRPANMQISARPQARTRVHRLRTNLCAHTNDARHRRVASVHLISISNLSFGRDAIFLSAPAAMPSVHGLCVCVCLPNRKHTKPHARDAAAAAHFHVRQARTFKYIATGHRSPMCQCALRSISNARARASAKYKSF